MQNVSPNHRTAPQYDLIVIGGGAAGFFGAINTCQLNPEYKVLILEKSPKLLSKVKISGGGRCNVTHNCFEATPLSQHYPRGQRELKKCFRTFQASDTVAWFAKQGVQLKAEDDGRMFPDTDNSQTIIDCLMKCAEKFGIAILTGCGAASITGADGALTVKTTDKREIRCRKILVASGGHPDPHAYDWLAETGHSIAAPIPSLFTFNDSEKKFKDLMGLAVADAEVKIAGTKFTNRGPVLITHWGLSGPGVIRLSAWAATALHEANYDFTALVNWTGSLTEEQLREQFLMLRQNHPKRKLTSNVMFSIPQRLWDRLMSLSEVDGETVWGEISNKEMNRFIEYLMRCPFQIKGKTTFKEEFVTCGGVNLSDINLETMESRRIPNVYFAGEVVNIDGETGGFNFQAAWTTGFIAAQSIAKY